MMGVRSVLTFDFWARRVVIYKVVLHRLFESGLQTAVWTGEARSIRPITPSGRVSGSLCELQVKKPKERLYRSLNSKRGLPEPLH